MTHDMTQYVFQRHQLFANAPHLRTESLSWSLSASSSDQCWRTSSLTLYRYCVAAENTELLRDLKQYWLDMDTLVIDESRRPSTKKGKKAAQQQEHVPDIRSLELD